MARTKGSGRRRGRPTAAGNGSAANLLLSQVTELVAENQSLVRENKALHSILARVSQAVEGVRAVPIVSRGTGAPTQVRKVRRRRKITDPASLERRRAALAKARAVLAERRASKTAE
jgi:hypothetical protein